MNKATPLNLFAALMLALASPSFAASVDDLVSKAFTEGRASGVITGSMADDLRKMTRSMAQPKGDVVREMLDGNGCATFRFTLTQPEIPTSSGGIAGDYVTTTRFTLCPGSQKNPPAEVVECRVGAMSCMPASR